MIWIHGVLDYYNAYGSDDLGLIAYHPFLTHLLIH